MEELNKLNDSATVTLNALLNTNRELSNTKSTLFSQIDILNHDLKVAMKQQPTTPVVTSARPTPIPAVRTRGANSMVSKLQDFQNRRDNLKLLIANKSAELSELSAQVKSMESEIEEIKQKVIEVSHNPKKI